MIYGIGTDIVQIRRLKDIVDRWGKRFLSRVFTDDEIAYCYGKKEPYSSLAVRFAAKEALIKAIGADAPLSLKDIEVGLNPSGKPFIKMEGKLKDLFELRSMGRAHVSLSHEREYGIASVVVEAEL